MGENAIFQIILLQVFIYQKLHLKCYDHCYAISRKLPVLAFKWYIIYENTFKIDELMGNLIRKYQFFSYFHIRTNP